ILMRSLVAIGYATPYLVDPGEGNANLGVKVFFVWGSCCFLCIAFVFFFVKETKGLSLEEIDRLFEDGVPAWRSSGFKPTEAFADQEPTTIKETPSDQNEAS